MIDFFYFIPFQILQMFPDFYEGKKTVFRQHSKLNGFMLNQSGLDQRMHVSSNKPYAEKQERLKMIDRSVPKNRLRSIRSAIDVPDKGIK